MPETRSRALLWVVPVLLAGAAASAAGQVQDAVSPAPEALLQRAFEQRRADSLRQTIEIVVRNRAGDETRRRIAIAAKYIDGRLHSLGRMLEPDHLRGVTLLNIENPDRSDDHFLFLRSMGRVRRISSAQRKDAFLGTDLTYEDFELRRVEDFELEARPMAVLAGERVHVVAARPRFETGYEWVELSLAESDLSLLQGRYFKRGTDEPHKIIRVPRAGIRRFDGRALPTHMVVENFARGTVTEVWIHDLAVDPDLDDGLFTATSIEVGRPIPGLE